ncbi:signal peptidase II [Winkia neuii]|uniref:signal peptidase II n=1 Tax=Winkia neuii TaxID=33007 RepID=UPI000AB85B18|nr:signal peptidase II [Winkia neuii]
MNKWCIWAGASVLGVAVDFASKEWALGALSTGQKIPLLGSLLSLELVFNAGAAFSFLSSHTWVFTVLAALACLIIPFFVRRAHSGELACALGLLEAGALGNLLDRLFRYPGFGEGHVVDFLDYGNFFVGNVADIAIVAAVVWLALIELTKKEVKK